MRIKTLLCAAGVAAIAIPAMADSNVFSLNVVGYTTVIPTGGQFALLCNPLDNGTNTISSLLPGVGVGSSVQLWNGTGFKTVSLQFGGVWKSNGTNDNAVIYPGKGFFVKLAGTTPVTNTFVGSVTSTATIPSVTNKFSSGLALLGSMVPFTGQVTDTNVNLAAVFKTGNSVLKWNAAKGLYDTFSLSFGGAWKSNGVTVAAPSIGVAEGFFVNTGGTNWVQQLYFQ